MTDDNLALALSHHQSGRLDEAEVLYRDIVAANPSEPNALHLDGLLAHQTDRHDLAIDLIGRAIALHDGSALYHNNLGGVLRAVGQLHEAAQCFARAGLRAPDYAEAHYNLGAVLVELGRTEDAAGAFGNAVTAQPGFVEAHYQLAEVLRGLGRSAAAVVNYEKALALQPDFAEAAFGLAVALTLLGRVEDAARAYETALAHRPDLAEAANNLANIRQNQGQTDIAIGWLHRALELRPDYVDALNNLGLIQHDLGRLDEAVDCYQRAVAVLPDVAALHSNLGHVLREQGREAEAVVALRRAVALDPNLGEAQFSLGLALLAGGELREGWEKHEWRWKRKGAAPPRPFTQPWWEGQDPAGKTMLLWSEQGVGDEVTFANAIPDLLKTGARCILECDRRLVPLFARSFPGIEVIARTLPPHPRTADPAIAWQCPTGSLLRWLRPTIESFPKVPGFLEPDPARVAFFRERLAALGPGPKIGISWRSSLMDGRRGLQFSTLASWTAILRTSGAQFINLQYGDCAEALAEAQAASGVRVHDFADLDLKDDIDGVAALCRALDLVITGPSSVVNFAGSVGTPVWHIWRLPDWELLGRKTRPCYPAERLFTAPWTTGWDDLLGNVAAALREWTQARGR